MSTQNARHAILLISCPDQQGIVAAVTRFLSAHQGNILHLDQHVDSEENVFFMRAQWDLESFALPDEEIAGHFEAVASPFRMNWTIHFTGRTPRAAIFVSKLSHCLYDLLARYEAGEWDVSIPLVISNHDALRDVVERVGIRFEHLPVTKETRARQEQAQLALLEKHDIDFIILARYMQILSADFVAHYPTRIINIHHSFLPAFPGARPYHSAYARGVKIVGATSHYVTADLDAGPILEQDIIHVSHKDAIVDMVRKGRDLEKVVLARAVRLHLDNRVLVYNNKTVVFD